MIAMGHRFRENNLRVAGLCGEGREGDAVSKSEGFKNWSMGVAPWFAMLGAAIVYLKSDAPLREAQTHNADVGAEYAQMQVVQAAKPILHVDPVVTEVQAFMDVREVRIEPRVTNAGTSDAQVKGVSFDVFIGTPNHDTGDAIALTKKYVECKRIMDRHREYDWTSRPDTSAMLDKAEAADVQWAWTIAEQHRENCPHGRAFLVTDDSSDFTWEKLDDLARSRTTSTTLRPGQTAIEPFTLLVTDSQWDHSYWFRVVLSVNAGQNDAQSFEFLIPTFRRSGIVDGDRRVLMSRPEWQVNDSGPFRWEPDATLMPIDAGE